MYKTCKDCLIHFLEPKKCTDVHGLDTPPYEIRFGCPVCGGDYIDAIECDKCFNRIVGDYIKTKSGERICEKCYTHYELGEEIV